jgi:hypothetical protein
LQPSPGRQAKQHRRNEVLVADHNLNSRKPIEDDAALQPSYGAHVPDVEGFVKGKFVNFGILAGDTNIRSVKGIHVEDSIDEQLRNMPGSRGPK